MLSGKKVRRCAAPVCLQYVPILASIAECVWTGCELTWLPLCEEPIMPAHESAMASTIASQ